MSDEMYVGINITCCVSQSPRWPNDLCLLIFMSLCCPCLHWVSTGVYGYRIWQKKWYVTSDILASVSNSFLFISLPICSREFQNEVSCHVLGRGVWGKELKPPANSQGGSMKWNSSFNTSWAFIWLQPCLISGLKLHDTAS